MKKDVKGRIENRGGGITNSSGEPSATMEAESKLESLLSSLSNNNLSVDELPQLMRLYVHSLRLLGIDDKWASMELKGYTDSEETPAYRRQVCDVTYLGVKSG